MAGNSLTQILAAPLGEMVAEIGMGIAEAQFAIDSKTIENMKQIYSMEDDIVKELRNIGYRPTWYVIPEAEAEINIALTVSHSQKSPFGQQRFQLNGIPVDAAYQNLYDYSMNASSRLKIKFIPVPAPTKIDDMDVVPMVVGDTIGHAVKIFNQLSLNYHLPQRAENSDVIVEIDPPAGTIIEQGEIINVVLINKPQDGAQK